MIKKKTAKLSWDFSKSNYPFKASSQLSRLICWTRYLNDLAFKNQTICDKGVSLEVDIFESLEDSFSMFTFIIYIKVVYVSLIYTIVNTKCSIKREREECIQRDCHEKRWGRRSEVTTRLSTLLIMMIQRESKVKERTIEKPVYQKKTILKITSNKVKRIDLELSPRNRE